MSRGLGKLQRAILEALDADSTPGGVYNWSAIRAAVAKQVGGYGRYGMTSAFEASFSRAMRTLSQRGLVQYLRYANQIRYRAEGSGKR